MLLPNQQYAGIVDVPEYGVRGKRGDFEPLISEDLFYRAQAVLTGRLPSTTPKQRTHSDFPLRAFVRCESCDRGLIGSWSKGRSESSLEVPLRKGAAGTGFQIALELNSPLLVRKFYGDVKLPRAGTRSVGAAAGVVVGEAGEDVRRSTDVEVWIRIGTLEKRRRIACLPACETGGNADAEG